MRPDYASSRSPRSRSPILGGASQRAFSAVSILAASTARPLGTAFRHWRDGVSRHHVAVLMRMQAKNPLAQEQIPAPFNHAADRGIAVFQGKAETALLEGRAASSHC